MSKVKIKFIITTIFCGVFLSTMPTAAMYDDRTNSGCKTPQTSNIKENDPTSIKFNFFESNYSKEAYEEYKKYNKKELFQNQKDLAHFFFYKKINDMYEDNPCLIPDNYEKILDPNKIPIEMTKKGEKNYKNDLLNNLLPFIKLIKQCGQVFYIIDKKNPKFGEKLNDLKNAIKKENNIINFKEIDDSIDGIDQMFKTDFCCIKNLMNDDSFNKDNLEKSIKITKKAIKDIDKHILKIFEELICTNCVDGNVWEKNKNSVETYLGAIILHTYYCIYAVEENIKNICEKYQITIEEEKEEENLKIYNLNNLYELNLNEIKNGKFKIKLKKEIIYVDYTNISKLFSIFKNIFIDYKSHFSIIKDDFLDQFKTSEKMDINNYKKFEEQYESVDEDIYMQSNIIYNDSLKGYIDDQFEQNKKIKSRYELFGKKYYGIKRTDIIKDYIIIDKVYKFLEKIMSLDEGINKIPENEKESLKENMKETKKDILENIEEQIKNWRICYDLDEYSKKIREINRELDCYYYHLFRILNKNDYAKENFPENFSPEGTIINLDDIDMTKEKVSEYYNIPNDAWKKRFILFKNSDIYKKRYGKNYSYLYLIEDIKNIT